VAMLIVGAVGVRFFARVIGIQKEILIPVIFVLSLCGSYAMRQNIFDVYLTIAFGVVGYLMQRYQYPLSPILLALILGPMAEANLRRSMVVSGGDWHILFSRPIAVGLMALGVAFMIASVFNHKRIEKRLAAAKLAESDAAPDKIAL
jgi:putative tricarboxylic transport membrane protein